MFTYATLVVINAGFYIHCTGTILDERKDMTAHTEYLVAMECKTPKGRRYPEAWLPRSVLSVAEGK